MKRLSIYAAVALAALGAAAVPVAALSAIWVDHEVLEENLGITAVVCLFFSVVAIPTAGWLVEEILPKVPARLPRADRRRLRDKERQIRLEAEIKRLEEEAGLR